jgi:hypothetical protein
LRIIRRRVLGRGSRFREKDERDIDEPVGIGNLPVELEPGTAFLTIDASGVKGLPVFGPQGEDPEFAQAKIVQPKTVIPTRNLYRESGVCCGQAASRSFEEKGKNPPFSGSPEVVQPALLAEKRDAGIDPVDGLVPQEPDLE